ncbi:MAG: enoyl-CoA hydratase/isomerase family protein [Chloroflexi bacterium]|nr:enoyl-CoA hydratase/isomerase family protein [Chloroflexota bacterium]
MMSETLLLETPFAGARVLTINRPQALNALDLATMQAFATAVGQVAADDSLQVLVVTGAGRSAFCSGGDLSELSTRVTGEEALAMTTLMGDALRRLEDLPIPVIAAVNGYALGGGSEIALACDLRVVDAKARLGFAQGKMALIPGWGGGQRLLRLVGYARALEFLLNAHTLYADDLKALGLANRVAMDGHALDEALQWARQIAALPRDLLRAQKALLQAGLRRTYDDALTLERNLFPALWESEAHWEAVKAFLQRKK